MATALASRHVAKKKGRTSVRAGGHLYDYTTHVSHSSLRVLKPYLGTLGVSVADALTDSLTHVSSNNTIGTIQPLNVRQMSHFRRPLFRIEQGQPPTGVKKAEVVDTKEEVAVL